MGLLKDVIRKKNKLIKPIWLMRQAGRYLPEFRRIREKNLDFVKLCLDKKKVKEITLQPIKRFDLDAAIIFSDILMIPYGLGQKVSFKKNFGPQLGLVDIKDIKSHSEIKFKKRLEPVYKSMNMIKKDKMIKKKDLVGFVGGTWTILVYMLNRISPKRNLKKIFSDKPLIMDMIEYINCFIELHIKKQIKSGADVIQIFDSWAGLVKEKNIQDFIYNPTKRLVKFTKSMNTPCICFPRNIKNYYDYTQIVNPDVISIDYNADPIKILKKIEIPIQGGMNPRVLLTSKKNLKKTTNYYLDIFKNHPYIFNLGHGILPQTDPSMVDYLVKIVRKFNERSSKN
tara:strand:- start:2513 stop:3532 length:1020 start_codon:yes stop_codon:yes gene_type:complete